MARISTYKNDVDVVAADKWIGSDSQNNMQTKNFTAGAVAKFINKIGGQAQNLRYTYDDTSTYSRGSIQFDNGAAASVLLSSITTFNVSIYDTRSQTITVTDYFTNAFVGSDVLLTQCDDIKNWAIYTWNSANQKGTSEQYAINLTFKAGGGSLTASKDYFISLLEHNAGGSSDKNFTFSLPGNNLSYIITHNLNKYPAVSVFESGTNNEIFAEVTYNSLNQCTLTFTDLITGTVTFN